MIIYTVWYCNGKGYEDYYEELKGIYSTKERAMQVIERAGYTVLSNSVVEKFVKVVPKPTKACDFGVFVDGWEDQCLLKMHGICNKKCDFLDYKHSIYDQSYMYIQDFEVDE